MMCRQHQPSSRHEGHDKEKRLRRLTHPGPVSPERAELVNCDLSAFSFSLEAGASFNAAVTAGFERAGFAGGVAYLRGLVLGPAHYVIPSEATDGDHVAWYSAPFSPKAAVTVEKAVAIAGRRDGKPFVHCHGIWSDETGGRRMGHLLPMETTVAAEADAVALGSRGGLFAARHDPETNFTLFKPEPGESGHGEGKALVLRVRPNEDVTSAIEKACVAAGLTQAAVHGIGSLNGISFDDGRFVPDHATEVMIRRGAVAVEDGAASAIVEIAAVDMDGTIHEGVLARGDNPVCVTFELIIEPVD
jgi:predicted DNA-binding protein with PD1-like motif